SRLIEIPRQADGDAVGHDRTAGRDGALLIIPARIDANLAIRAVARSGDQKMIPAGGRIGPAGLAVMDEDSLPSAGLDGSLGVENFIERGFGFDDDEAARLGQEWGGGEDEQKDARQR